MYLTNTRNNKDPHGILVYQISKETTRKEVIEVEGIDRSISNIQNMLLTTGHVDAVEWCTNMLHFPTLEELENAYRKTHP